ncbi:hypothetical protein [Alistipes sp. An66]|uniref:hypothetical protein n=1 Tax=Alistipes sp. An66 TaxID=1965650 RepID=UPI000B3914FB|nr:hypothetical protein [Alistipes sp. An66]OUN59609.1 hypothetical protein B5G16_04630 [Alistipes sp. An66]
MKRILDKIVGWMNRIPADKYKHQALGADIAAVVLLALVWFVPQWLALTASVVAVIAAAVGKEKADAKADLRDIVATLCGGVVVWLPFLVAILIV